MAKTLTLPQVKTLMEFPETQNGGIWMSFFALCLFAGIRPGVPNGEITKLNAEAVDLDAGIIHISPEVSKVASWFFDWTNSRHWNRMPWI